MAKRITLTDDITPTVELPEGTGSTTLIVKDGRDSFAVEIDLGDDNFKKLITGLRKYRENGREVTPVTSTNGKPARDSQSDGPVIRKWAQDNPSLLPEGVAVPGDRGALSKAVVAAYDAHHATPATDVDTDTTDASEAPSE